MQEFIIWGIAPGSKNEQILFTKAQSLAEAQKVIEVLTNSHACMNCRVQVIDFNSKIDFKKTIN